jgi:hypothetical protein
MPCRVIPMTVGALPVRIGFGGRGSAKGVALCETASFCISTLLFLDLGKKQAQAALMNAFTFSDLDLVSRFAGQSSIERDLSQKKPTLRVGRISRNQTPGGLGPCQLIRLNGQRKGGKIGMRGALPGVRDA